MESRSATERVLNTVELLEAILWELANLDPANPRKAIKTLLSSQLVNCTFRNTIIKSKRLQKTLCFVPPDDFSGSGTLFCDPWKAICMTTTPLIRHREPIRLEAGDAKVSVAVRMTPECKEAHITFDLEGAAGWLPKQRDRPHYSWRKMHLIPGDYVVRQIGFMINGKQVLKTKCWIEGSNIGGWLSHVMDELAKDRAVESKSSPSAKAPSKAADMQY